MFFFLCCSNFFLHFLFFIFSFYCIHVSLRFSFVFLDGEVSNYISCRIFTSSPDCTFMFTAVIHIKKISINAVSHTKRKRERGLLESNFISPQFVTRLFHLPKMGRLLTPYSSGPNLVHRSQNLVQFSPFNQVCHKAEAGSPLPQPSWPIIRSQS